MILLVEAWEGSIAAMYSGMKRDNSCSFLNSKRADRVGLVVSITSKASSQHGTTVKGCSRWEAPASDHFNHHPLGANVETVNDNIRTDKAAAANKCRYEHEIIGFDNFEPHV